MKLMPCSQFRCLGDKRDSLEVTRYNPMALSLHVSSMWRPTNSASSLRASAGYTKGVEIV